MADTTAATQRGSSPRGQNSTDCPEKKGHKGISHPRMVSYCQYDRPSVGLYSLLGRRRIRNTMLKP